MKRFLPLLALLALVAAPLPATASSKVAPRDALTGFVCQRALDPPNRSVSVKAVMRPVPGTRSLALKFDLLQKQAGATRIITGAGDLGVWLSPKDPSLGRRSGDIWELTKAVSNLGAPAGYRFRVTFRWLGAHDNVLGTVTRQSAGCTQRELRPDVLVKSVVVTAIAHKPHKQLYTAVIANRGASSAGPFQVLFAPAGGAASRTLTVTRIAAHSARRLSFVGPLCTTASPPTIVADSANQVDDSDRGNNAITVTCPS